MQRLVMLFQAPTGHLDLGPVGLHASGHPLLPRATVERRTVLAVVSVRVVPERGRPDVLPRILFVVRQCDTAGGRLVSNPDYPRLVFRRRRPAPGSRVLALRGQPDKRPEDTLVESHLGHWRAATIDRTWGRLPAPVTLVPACH